MLKMSDTLRARLLEILDAEHRQLLSDFDVDAALLDADPQHAEALEELVNHIVIVVRMHDAPPEERPIDEGLPPIAEDARGICG